MKMNNKSSRTLLYFSLITFLTMPLFAEEFKIKNVRLGGVGCPSDLINITYAPDNSSASLIFSQFQAAVPVEVTGPKVNPNISSLNCNIFIDIAIANGNLLSSIDLKYDLRGFVSLDRGVNGSFKSHIVSVSGLGMETSIPSRNPILVSEKAWTNSGQSQEEDFIIESFKSITTPSQCSRNQLGDTVTVRLQQNLTAQILKGFERQAKGTMIIDTSDISGGLKISGTTRNCRNTLRDAPRLQCEVIRTGGRSHTICR